MGVIEMWPGDKLVETWHKRPMSPFFISREFLLIPWIPLPLVDIVQAYKSDLSLFFLDSLLWLWNKFRREQNIVFPIRILVFAVCTGGGCSCCLLDHHRSFFLNTNWNKWDRLPLCISCISCIFFILIYFPSFISCIFLKYFSRIQIEINKTSCLRIVEDHAQNHKHK